MLRGLLQTPFSARVCALALNTLAAGADRVWSTRLLLHDRIFTFPLHDRLNHAINLAAAAYREWRTTIWLQYAKFASIAAEEAECPSFQRKMAYSFRSFMDRLVG